MTSNPPTEASEDPQAGLLRRLRLGGAQADEALFELIDLVRKPLMGLLRSKGATTELAEDIVHDTLFKARDALAEFRGESRLTSWLYKIALNLLVDRQRREKLWVDVQAARWSDDDGEEIDMLTRRMDETMSAPSTEEVVRLRRLRKCIDEHFPKFRRDHPERAEELNQMVTWGWGPKEMAELSGEPGTAIRKRLQRHREILRRYLEPCADDYGGRLP